MTQKKKLLTGLLVVAGILLALYAMPAVFASAAVQSDTATKAPEAGRDSGSISPQPINATRAAREEKALQDARRQQLAEKEAALAAKEQELKKLSDKLEAQVKALEESKKRLDDTVKAQSEAQKKLQDEKITKMVKLFKTIKSEQAGKMIDSLKEDTALILLSRMDTKSVAKLAPFISQPRLIKWVNENMQGR